MVARGWGTLLYWRVWLLVVEYVKYTMVPPTCSDRPSELCTLGEADLPLDRSPMIGMDGYIWSFKRGGEEGESEVETMRRSKQVDLLKDG